MKIGITCLMNTFIKYFVGLLVVAAVGFAGWTWITLEYTYSKGERAGYVQKISQKGWVCKTWEGELAMANLPGAMPQIFQFTVRNADVARQIEKNSGQRVSLSYEQHRGIPTACFGDTEYFIVRVTPFTESTAPSMTPPPASTATQVAAPAVPSHKTTH
jgi:hypothetical protein